MDSWLQRPRSGEMPGVGGDDRGDQGGGGFGDSRPDWTRLSPSERVRYLLEAAANSPTERVNVHNVFRNFKPEVNALSYGSDALEPVTVMLGGETYRIALSISVIVKKSGNYNPVINMSLTLRTPLNNRYGNAYGYNIGHNMDIYLIIYEEKKKVEAFERWYGY